MGAEIEGLFDGCHRERPGEAAGTYDKKVDRVRHRGLQSGIGKHPCDRHAAMALECGREILGAQAPDASRPTVISSSSPPLSSLQ